MTELEILECLETYLYNSQRNSIALQWFYAEKNDGKGNLSFEFSNKSVERLLALSQRLTSEKEKQFFWEVVTPAKITLIPFLAFANRGKGRINRMAFEKQEFIFMLYAKSNKLDDILDIVQNNIIICQERHDLFFALYEALLIDSSMFSKVHIDNVLSVVETYRAFLSARDFYFKNKRLNRGNANFKEETKYESVREAIATSFVDMLQMIKDEAFNIKAKLIDTIVFEGANLEINQDRQKLLTIIDNFGFDPSLTTALEKIDQKLNEAQDKFELKGCIDLIRTFLEKICVSIASVIEKQTKISPPEPISNQMGKARNYFRDKRINFLTEKEDKLLEALFGFMSDAGAHALNSEKEEARISKNLVIEEGVFLGRKLDKFLSEKAGSKGKS